MGKRKCCVKSCQSETDRPEDVGVTFHRIPFHPDIRPKWIELCQLDDDKKNSFVCSRHFLRADFCNFKGKRYMLRQGVLPSIFPWNKSLVLGKKSQLGKPTESYSNPEEKTKAKRVKKKNPEATKKAAKTKAKKTPDKVPVLEISEIKKEIIEQEEDDDLPPPVLEPMDIVLPSTPDKEPDDTIPELEASIVEDLPPKNQPEEPENETKVENKVENSPKVAEEEEKPQEKEEEAPKDEENPTGKKEKLRFEPDTQIEVFDGAQTWSSGTIIEVDYEENEVLVHFDNLKKSDEWIGITSANIRAPLTEEEKLKLKEEEEKRLEEQRKKEAEAALKAQQEEKLQAEKQQQQQTKTFETFKVNERCMAYWFDSNKKFPATVLEIHEDNTYTVKFDDGYIITVKADKMTKASMFANTNQETKEERRNKKRKLNVTSLFKQSLSQPGFKKKVRKSLGENPNHEKDVSFSGSSCNASFNESILPENPDAWYPSFVNDMPVGEKSVVTYVDGERESYLVPDPRLPPNWERHLLQKHVNHNKVHNTVWYSVIISPEGRRFRSRPDMEKYISEHPELKDYIFDLTVRPSNKRRSYIPLLPAAGTTEELKTTEESELPTGNNGSTTPKEPERTEPLLKILQVDGGFQCPIDGCGKCFRRENLAQMHVKHYHPEFSKFLDNTPNVLDMIYARLQLEDPETIIPSNKVGHKSWTYVPIESNAATNEKDSEIKRLLNLSSNGSSLDGKEAVGPPAEDNSSSTDLLNSEFRNHIVTTKSGLKTIPPVRHRESFNREKEDRKVEADGTAAAVAEEDVDVESQQMNAGSQYHIIEGGEVIKIVRMKQEEIINCTCGITEEDGLMIQCELCMCWQHAHCNSIFRETDVPDKYICYICQNPIGQRTSTKYMHDQEWLKRGALPTASYHWTDEEALGKRKEQLKVSHDITGGLIELKEFANTLRMKIKIAEVKNHPKLYLWSKPWDKSQLPEHEMDSKVKIKEEVEEDEEENGQHKEDLPKLDLKDLIVSNLQQQQQQHQHELSAESLNVAIPEPEAAIKTEDCRVNLLEHVAHSQTLIEQRLEYFEKQIADLDAEIVLDDIDDEEDEANVRLTTNLLLRDLNLLKQISQISTF